MRLTREQRAALFCGKWPTIKGEGKCPVEPGYVYRLSSRLSIEVVGDRDPRANSWSIEYVVHDRRPDRNRYLGSAPALSDEERMTKKWTDDEALGYTGNPKSALADAGTAIPPDEQQAMSDAARAKWAVYESENRLEEVVHRQQRAIANKIRRLMADAAKHGVDITPHLVAALRAAEQEVAQTRQDAA